MRLTRPVRNIRSEKLGIQLEHQVFFVHLITACALIILSPAVSESSVVNFELNG